MPEFTLRINGQEHKVNVAPDTPLLWVLRDTLNLTGTKQQCHICYHLSDRTPVHNDQGIVRRAKLARATDGPAAAFVLLGAWMMCYHFMYYDVLLAALPVALLFMQPRRWLEPIFVAVLPLAAASLPAGLLRWTNW